MARYLVKRVALGLLVVVGVVCLTFVIARVVPGDPAASWVGPHATPQELAQAHHDLGLDDPLPVQIVDYLGGVVRGDWGVSIHTKRSVLSDLGTRAPASVELVVAALLIALLLGVPLGLASARWHSRTPDVLVRFVAVGGVSMPVFWLALILQLVFFQKLGVLPVAGEYDPDLDYTSPLTQYTHVTVIDSLVTGNWPVLGSSLQHLVLPAFVVACYPLGVIARMVRASVLETLGEEHVRMVRALGFPERTVFWRFGLKPSMNPIVAIVALVFAYSLVNTFLVEAIFNWPGLGSYVAASTQTLDTPAIIGVTMLVAIVYVVSNLLVDVVQAFLDPRIRLQ